MKKFVTYKQARQLLAQRCVIGQTSSNIVQVDTFLISLGSPHVLRAHMEVVSVVVVLLVVVVVVVPVVVVGGGGGGDAWRWWWR